MRHRLLPEEFIRKSNLKHEGKYSYKKANYIDSKTKVLITCPVHGDFEQTPGNHLQGYGCSRCSFDKQILTQKEIISKFTKIHGTKYDYSKTVYLGVFKKVTIICPEHGEFEQTSDAHLQGRGCRQCGINARIKKQTRSIDGFIQLAEKAHNCKYNYSKTIYVNSRAKVTITCPVHGDFEQTPNNHLRGKGCPRCAIELNSKALCFSAVDFIEKARRIHDKRYDYSKVNYTNSQTKVTITCPTHGDFEQIPNSHLQGSGCKQCMFDKLSVLHRSNRGEFVQKARLIHGDKYGYKNSIYINNRTKITVTCSKHGDFLITPQSHLSGGGCPLCKASKGETLIATILDKHGIKYIKEYRIPEVLNRYPYDFYLPDRNLLVEFHGKQHYEYIPFFHRNGEDDFLQQKNRDDIKKYNALHYKYRYLEVNYKKLKQLTKRKFEEEFLKRIMG